MKSLWQEGTRSEVLERLGRLTPSRQPSWGRMSATRMVAHLNESLRMALGDLPTKSKRLPFRHPPLKQLIVYWMPFPKSAPTAPELLAREPAAWSAEVESCRDLVERFAVEPRGREWPEHPAFGRLSAHQWGVITYRHMDHHLRQFQV